MAVLISGNETIVKYSRGLVGTYYALVFACGIISVLCLIVAFGTAIDSGSHYHWNEISNITYEHDWRKRVCRFRTGQYDYTLTQNNCPSPGKVAQLLAERKGVPLLAPGVGA